MKAPILTNTGISGHKNISDAIFSAPVNKELLAQAILVYRSNLRQGTGSSKTRSLVAGTTKKAYRQKGTGNARHGAKTAPIFVGGGVAHGPNGGAQWTKSLTKKTRSQALVSALSAQSENMYVSDYVNELTGKTQEAAALLAPLREHGKVLVLLHDASPVVLRALQNLHNVYSVPATQVTALHVAQAHKIVLTSKALEVIENRVTESVSKKTNKV